MKNNDKCRTVYMSNELDGWVKEQAEKNNRSVVAQIRHYLELIKAGKIKVEGVE